MIRPIKEIKKNTKQRHNEILKEKLPILIKQIQEKIDNAVKRGLASCEVFIPNERGIYVYKAIKLFKKEKYKIIKNNWWDYTIKW